MIDGASLPARNQLVNKRGCQCRCKVRMSGLSKVEMSGFMGAWRSHGNGANGLESTRAGPIEGVTRNRGRAFNAGCGGAADQINRPSGASVAAAPTGARRPGGDPWITRATIEPQVPRFLRA